jgi:hypothetical protein
VSLLRAVSLSRAVSLALHHRRPVAVVTSADLLYAPPPASSPPLGWAVAVLRRRHPALYGIQLVLKASSSRVAPQSPCVIALPFCVELSPLHGASLHGASLHWSWISSYHDVRSYMNSSMVSDAVMPIGLRLGEAR